MIDQATAQVSDPYDGILPVLEARVETHRAIETEREVMQAIETDPELATAQTTPTPMGPGTHSLGKAVSERAVQSDATGKYHAVIHPNYCPHCEPWSSGPIRTVRSSDDTVRHLNGEKCKRFHAS